MYDITIQKIREYEYHDENYSQYQYVLWMCDQIEMMVNNSLKAARWMGYVLKTVEDLGFWNNETSRDYIREDVRNGNDLP